MKNEQVLFTPEEENDLFDYSYNEPGSIPGTLSIEPDADPSQITLIRYNAQEATCIKNISPAECRNYLKDQSQNYVFWVDVSGLGSEDILNAIGDIFNLHSLILEDVVNVPQRPKVEDYKDQVLVITQMVMLKDSGEGVWIEQVSFVVGRDYVVTIQEEPERDCFNLIRDRLRHGKGAIRERNAGYLTYALWDAIIDGYFPVLDAYSDKLQDLEDEVVIKPTSDTLNKIYNIKRELLAVRRAIWPQRDALNSLIRDHTNLVDDELRIYLKDCYDHTVEIIDIVETYRELAGGLMEVYLSAAANKMNEIMKLLTIISTIFIPLTFVAGVYGMNFDPDSSPLNMPELKWYWGYPACILLMVVIALTLGYFFWKRGWFKAPSGVHLD